jgi:hypothetical protein
MTQLQSLREECLTALEAYTRQAQKTCELLADVESPEPSLDRLFAVVAQTKTEDKQQHEYLMLRQRLFDMLYVGPDSRPRETCTNESRNSAALQS